MNNRKLIFVLAVLALALLAASFVVYLVASSFLAGAPEAASSVHLDQPGVSEKNPISDR